MSDDTRITIADIERSRRETLRIELNVYKGKPLLNARIWFKDEGGELSPGREGWAINPERIAELFDAIGKARAEALLLGWIVEKEAA
jgi:hypothetical protein